MGTVQTIQTILQQIGASATVTSAGAPAATGGAFGQQGGGARGPSSAFAPAGENVFGRPQPAGAFGSAGQTATQSSDIPLAAAVGPINDPGAPQGCDTMQSMLTRTEIVPVYKCAPRFYLYSVEILFSVVFVACYITACSVFIASRPICD